MIESEGSSYQIHDRHPEHGTIFYGTNENNEAVVFKFVPGSSAVCTEMTVTACMSHYKQSVHLIDRCEVFCNQIV